MTTLTSTTINGIDVQQLQQSIDAVAADPPAGLTRWTVNTRWAGGTLSRTHVKGFEIGGRHVPQDFTLTVDEPHELCGTAAHPNPQQYLMAAMNACMMVGYVAVASLMGVELESVEIESDGEIDLRGFFGLDPTVKPGYDAIHYTVRIKGNGTPQQFRTIHETVMATSPNRYNIANPIRLTADLIVQ